MSNTENQIDLRRFIRATRKGWWLYALTFIVLMGGAIAYSLLRMPAYETTASMLIEDSSDASPSGGGLSNLLGRSFSLGGFGSSSVNNEIYILDSHDLLINTAKDLKLNVNYISYDGLKRDFLYPDSPVDLQADYQYFDTLSLGYTIKLKIKENGTADLECVRGRFIKKVLYEATDVTLPFVCEDKAFPVTIAPTEYLEKGTAYDININVSTYEDVAAMIIEKVLTDTPDKLADVIQLSFIGPNKEYNKRLLNGLFEEYNKMRIERRREIAKREIEFLDQRLADQLSALNSAEQRMEEYKTQNNLSGIEEEVKMLVGKTVENEKELLMFRSTREYYRQVLAAIRDPKSDSQLIPVTGETSDPLIDSYNNMILQRKQLMLSATPDNAQLKIVNSNLADLRNSIEEGAKNAINQATIRINAYNEDNNVTENRLRNMPSYEREFFNLTRDSQMQNELYLFLSEKRENAMLKYDSNSTLGFVIESAYCSIKPSKKKSIIACGAALLLSLILPSIAVLLWMMMRNKVESSIDLNFDNLEAHTVNISSPEDMRTLRRLITDNPQWCNLYCYNLSSNANLPVMLGDSLQNIEYSVDIFNNAANNDAILAQSFGASVSASDTRYRIISVPSDGKIIDLQPLLRQATSCLVIFVDADTVKRSYFKQLINCGITAANTLIGVVKK